MSTPFIRDLYILQVFNCFFFFKQKTAYEMRISDWSSDVCSSDLQQRRRRRDPAGRPQPFPASLRTVQARACATGGGFDADRICRRSVPSGAGRSRHRRAGDRPQFVAARPDRLAGRSHRRLRSEEHTSELQSLMRISYAVFCWKKKKNLVQLHKKTKAARIYIL